MSCTPPPLEKFAAMDILVKKARTPRAKRCYIDRLSPLPDDILHHIFSFLDVLDAVRTCMLSRRWMNFWLSAPCWNFSMDRFIEHYDDSNVHGNSEARYRFWEFINWALVQKALCPRRISLSSDDTMVDKINELLLLAAKHEVREICLSAGDYEVKELIFPGALCETLTSLTIDFRDVISLRAAMFFSNLRSLYLRGVVLSNDTVEKIFSCNSTHLEDVHLEGCEFNDSGVVNIYSYNLRNLTIANIYCFSDALWIVSCLYKYSFNVCAPNLVSFTYIGPMLGSFNLSNSTSLRHALIRIMNVPQRYSYSNKYKNLFACPTKFVGLIPSKSLTLSSLVVKHSSLTYGDMHMGNFMLDNLNCLKVGLRNGVDYIEGLINLLWLAPNLEALVVRFRKDRQHCCVKGNQGGGSQTTGTWKSWIENIACLSYHLKRVEISGVNGSEIVLGLVRFLLEKGKALEKVEIQYRREERTRKFFSKLVAALPKASPKVAISFPVVQNQREFNWFQCGDSDPDYE